MPRKPKRPPRGFLDLAALALLARVPDWKAADVAAIARKLGCHVRSLTPARCPKFNAELRRHRARYRSFSSRNPGSDAIPDRIDRRRGGRLPRDASDDDWD